MESSSNFTEKDLDVLIENHLADCTAYSNICHLNQTDAGKERIVKRIKEILFSSGTKNLQGKSIEAAIATVESELSEIILSEN